MADVYIYADESGNLDYEGADKRGASPYFGFGTATWDRDHGPDLFAAARLRMALERSGVRLPGGFHAKDDSLATKDEVYSLIAGQQPRIDTTFLLKENAYPRVRAAGQMRLYKMAWFLHFKHIAFQVSQSSDHLYVIVGEFGTKARAAIAREALADVVAQVRREVTLCVWTAASSWGLQVADYALWAVHRELRGQACRWYPQVDPLVVSTFTPWGRT